MSKKTKKAQEEVHEVTNNTDTFEHQTGDTNHMSEETSPATIVESAESVVFAVQTEGQETVDTSKAENLTAEGQEATTEGLETQPEEKPAPKPRVNKRPYIAMVTEHFELGDMDRKELVNLVLKEFPTVKKGGVETFLTDCLNPKYSFFKDRVVTKSPGGKLIFADRLIPGIIVAEQDRQAEQTEAQPTEAETPPAEAVPTEEAQPEQPAG
jgi:hypothetical protein